MRTIPLLVMVLIAGVAEAPQHPGDHLSFEGPASSLKFDDGISGQIAGELTRETQHFQIYIEKSYVPVDLDWLQVEVEKIFEYLVDRMGSSTTEKFALTFRPPDTSPCPMRGLAHSDEVPAQVIVFADRETSRSQLSGVLAHEIAHLFQTRVLRAGASDGNLAEGMASWAAGKYWQAWQGAPADNVRAFRSENRYKPLEEYYLGSPPDTDRVSCWQNRDRRYNSWAAFIDFLIADYGMDKFRQLLGPERKFTGATLVRVENLDEALQGLETDIRRARANTAGSSNSTEQLSVSILPVYVPVSDFKTVYDLSLTELEEVWLERLNKEGPR